MLLEQIRRIQSKFIAFRANSNNLKQIQSFPCKCKSFRRNSKLLSQIQKLKANSKLLEQIRYFKCKFKTFKASLKLFNSNFHNKIDKICKNQANQPKYSQSSHKNLNFLYKHLYNSHITPIKYSIMNFNVQK